MLRWLLSRKKCYLFLTKRSNVQSCFRTSVQFQSQFFQEESEDLLSILALESYHSVKIRRMLFRGSIDHKTAFWKLLLFRCVCVRPPWKWRVTNRVESPFSPSFKELFPWKNSQTLLARGTLCGAAATTTRVLTAKGSKLVLNHPPIVLLKSPHSIKSIVRSHWRCGTNSFKHCFLSDFSSLQKIFGTLWILLETFDSSLIHSWSIIEK